MDEKRPPTTEELVLRARSDPEDGFASVYRRVAPALYGWIALHIHEPLRPLVDPEDVLQEVVCRAYGSFETYEPGRTDFRGWIFGIARNVMREVLRDVARGGGSGTRSKVREPASVDQVADSATRISQRMVRDEELASFLEVVRALPDEERRLLVHRGLEGLPHEQVAELLNVTPQVATRRWGRLRERLRAQTELVDILAA